VGHRAKTDRRDAQLLARYLQGTGVPTVLAASRSAPDRALAPVEASCNARSDERSAAPEPGRYWRTG
jgi:transposase